jgi:hypothetical protein
VTRVKKSHLTATSDARGLLVAGQFPDDIPFQPRRMFIVSRTPVDSVRGGHAHRTCHQYLVSVHGMVEVEWDDDDGTQIVILDDPTKGLYVPPLAWARQTYRSPDSVLVVLASHPYDVDDYVDDREEAAILRQASA